jgi:adenylate cyclase
MRLLNSKTMIVLSIALVCTVLAWNWRLNDPQFMRDARELTFDAYQRLKPRKPLGQPIRVVDIDEASIAEYGQWPWPRTKLAEIVDRLAEYGALTIAFDMVFSEPDRTGPQGFIQQLEDRNWPGKANIEDLIRKIPDNDEIFAESLARAPTVLGFFNDSKSRLGLPSIKAGFAILGDDPKPVLPRISSSVVSLPIFQDAAVGHGSISLGRQSDDVVRQVPMFSTDGENIYPAMAIEALRVVQGAPSFTLKTSSASGEYSGGDTALIQFKVGQFAVPVTQQGNMLIYAAPVGDDMFLSARQLLDGSREEIQPLIEGHIVFVGASASGLRDIRTSALGESVPGVYMHAQIVDQILSGEFLSRPDWATGAEIAAMTMLVALIVVVLPFAGAIISALFGLLASLAVVGASWYAFTQYGLLLDPLFPMLCSGAIFVMTTILLFAFAEREKRFVRGAFQRYLAPDLLNKLERNPDSLKLGGEIRDMTLMFMDIRGFTPISEKLSPESLVTFLNQLLSPLSEVIQNHEGAIDKYIGDSIMAFWNAPLDVEDHPRKAAHAALAMLHEIERLNSENTFGFHGPPLELGDVKIGIGLNTGECCVGNMGSAKRFDYSVIGDAVNIASRIESSCKAVGWALLISQITAEACSDFAMLEAGAIELKGKSAPMLLFALVGDENMAKTQEWQTLHANHRSFRDAIERGDAAAAEKARLACLEFKPADLTSFYEKYVPAQSATIAAE